MSTEADLPVVHNTAAKRFEIDLDGKGPPLEVSARR